MKATYKLLLSLSPAVLAVIFIALATPSWSVDLPGEWQNRAPSSTIRQEVSYVEADGKFYLAGGSRVHERYDPKTNSWQRIAPLPVRLDHIQGVELNGKLYYVGGLAGWPKPAVGTVYVYNPSTNTFSEGTPMPAGRERGAGGVAAHGGKIYYAGGLHEGKAVAGFDVYDPATGTWNQLPDMPRPRDHFQAAVVDGKFYAIGGRDSVINATTTAVDVYDLSQGAGGTWQTLDTALPTPRGGFATAVLGKEILVIGGEGGGIAHNAVEAYDTVTNTWRSLEPMPMGRHGIQAAVCNGGVYIAAGGTKEGGGGATSIHQVFFLNGATTCQPSGDTTAPTTTVKSGPSGATNDNTPTFTFTGSDDQTVTADLLFSYKVNDGAWSAYQADTSVTLGGAGGLPDGSHTFYVRAKDAAGNEDASPAQQHFTVDTIAPTIERVSPVDGATGADPATNVSASFSEAMRPPSINTNTFKLFEKGTTTVIPATVTYDAANKQAILNPSADLQPGTTYKALVAIGVRDLANNQMATSKVWFFTVGG